MWEVMMWPVVACVLLPGLLVYLGLHVVRRGIIFIDIAMAQMASLGVCFAVMKHMDPDSPLTFWISLGFTLLAAALFARFRSRDKDGTANKLLSAMRHAFGGHVEPKK